MTKATDFSLPDQKGDIHKLSSYLGSWVVLYFYPKDDTPGCTKEACTFRDSLPEYTKRKIVILGVSKDSVESHAKFGKKYNLNFPLLADPDHQVIEKYDAWQEKKFMGRTFLGTIRMTYLINPKGEIFKIYPKVSPLTHAEEILKDFDSANS